MPRVAGAPATSLLTRLHLASRSSFWSQFLAEDGQPDRQTSMHGLPSVSAPTAHGTLCGAPTRTAHLKDNVAMARPDSFTYAWRSRAPDLQSRACSSGYWSESLKDVCVIMHSHGAVGILLLSMWVERASARSFCRVMCALTSRVLVRTGARRDKLMMRALSPPELSCLSWASVAAHFASTGARSTQAQRPEACAFTEGVSQVESGLDFEASARHSDISWPTTSGGKSCLRSSGGTLQRRFRVCR